MGRHSRWFDASPEALVVIDAAGSIIHVNKRFAAQVAPLSRVLGLSFSHTLLNPDEILRFGVAVDTVLKRIVPQPQGECSGARSVTEVAPVLKGQRVPDMSTSQLFPIHACVCVTSQCACFRRGH